MALLCEATAFTAGAGSLPQARFVSPQAHRPGAGAGVARARREEGFHFHEWNNRINRLSYDFVVCAMDSTVLAAIELDDSSHGSPSREEADRKKERATAAAGLPLIRWHVKSLPDQSAIRAAFAFAANGGDASAAAVEEARSP